MKLLDVILRARAATYLDTSMVVLTEPEFQQYLVNVINFRYPSLKVWSDIYKATQELPADEQKAAQSNLITSHIETHFPGTPSATVTSLIKVLVERGAIEDINTFYDLLTDNPQPDSEDLLYEWWLGVPTGPESCSRDIGDARTFNMDVEDSEINLPIRSKGDEWDINLETKILVYQSSKAKLGILPTGYICTETLRRLRLDS